MYHAHFGLERGLFGEGIAADSAVFRTARHDRLIAHFKLALGAPSSAVALRGPAGVGKTTLTSAALRMTSTRLALAWLGGTATNPTELLELILVELGLNTLRTTRIERVQLWRQYLAEMRATDSRLFLVVERTEDLAAEVLHSLDQLTAPDAAGNPGANLVLLGNEGLDAHLAAPILDSLRQRIRLRGVLEPFSEAELQDYLRHQTACAGGSYDRIFAPGTVAALFRYSRGVARLVNNLCESALDVAAVQQQKQLTADLVARTAVSLLGLSEPVPVPRTTSVALEPAVPTDRRAAPRPTVSPSELSPAVAPPAPALTPEAQPAAASPPAEPPRAAPTAVAPLAASPAPVAPITTAPFAPTAPTAAAPPASSAPIAAAPQAPTTAAPPAPTSPLWATPPATASLATTPPPPSPPPLTERRAAPAPAAPVLASSPPTAAKAVEIEFDGSATDVADVAFMDFPVLTDAVDAPPAAPAKPTTSPPPGAPVKTAVSPPPAAWSRPPASAAAAAPVAQTKPRSASRIETAYTATRPPSPALAAAAAAATAPSESPSPAAAPAKPPPAATTPADLDDDDVLRQTQTMRAIAVAKSIDDISSSMAETLFSDAELDLVTAALAAEWPDENDEAAEPQAESVKPATEIAKPATAATLPADDPFDLFGLGDDAPLELIDDSAQPPKTASR